LILSSGFVARDVDRTYGLLKSFVFGRRWMIATTAAAQETSRELGNASYEKLDSSSGGAKKRILVALFWALIAFALLTGVLLFEARSDTGDGERVNEPSAAATGQPTHSPSISLVATQFANGFLSYSKDLVENDLDSPQAKAFSWLQEDTLYKEYQLVYRLNQRYALAVLYYTTNGPSWLNTMAWLSNDMNARGSHGQPWSLIAAQHSACRVWTCL
jgi:hypothetical protein